MRYLKFISLALLLWPLSATAREVPCDMVEAPVICEFLNRYISDLRHWNRSDISIGRKMMDDKFVVLDGSLDNIEYMSDSTSFSLTRFDDKAYEAVWTERNRVLLRVAFPIQYELILGMPQIEIEKHLQEYIKSAVPRDSRPIPSVDSIGENVYQAVPKQYYQLPNLNNCCYLEKDSSGNLQYICDSARMEYTIPNLFLNGLSRNYLLDVRQKIYGFKNLTYTMTLDQWLNYCYANNITCYLAIEEETDEMWQILIIAECKDLAYNHILSVFVPKDIMQRPFTMLPVSINAFVPTHNVSNLYEQYINKARKERKWKE